MQTLPAERAACNSRAPALPTSPIASADYAEIPAPGVVDVMATAEARYKVLGENLPDLRRWWQNAPDDKKRESADRIARMVVLAHSPIGRAAARVDNLTDQLDRAVESFLEDFSKADVTEALRSAGLASEGSEHEPWTADSFDPLFKCLKKNAGSLGRMAAVCWETGGRLGEVVSQGTAPVREATAGPVDVDATARLHCADDPSAWESLTPAEKHVNGTRLARRLVLAQSAIAADALHVSRLADELHDAMQHFTATHDAAEVERLLCDAGLHEEPAPRPDGWDRSWRADHFQQFLTDVEGFTFVVGRIADAVSEIAWLDRDGVRTAVIVRKAG